VLHGDGPSTEIQYRLAWARTYLKGMGLLTNSQRGVWSVTELGQAVKEDQIAQLHAEFVATTWIGSPLLGTPRQPVVATRMGHCPMAGAA
jgi:restriction endonuclease Mrr